MNKSPKFSGGAPVTRKLPKRNQQPQRWQVKGSKKQRKRTGGLYGTRNHSHRNHRRNGLLSRCRITGRRIDLRKSLPPDLCPSGGRGQIRARALRRQKENPCCS